MNKTRMFLTVVLTFLCINIVEAKSIKETFPINGSSEKYPSGYLSLHGNYEAFSWHSTSWKAYGGGFAIGLKLVQPIYLEAYLDYLTHKNTPTITESAHNYVNSLHSGGRTVVMLSNYFFVKGGFGIANLLSGLGYDRYTTNKLEINMSAGFALPINAVFHFDFHFLYRRIFDTPGINMFGGVVGLLVRFY